MIRTDQVPPAPPAPPVSPLPTYTTAQIAQHVDGQLTGPDDLTLNGLADLDRAQPDQLTFLGDVKLMPAWESCAAGAVLVSEGIEAVSHPERRQAVITVPSADLAMASVLELYAPPPPVLEPGIHPTAIVDPTATLGEGCALGPYCVVGPHAVLGKGCTLHAHATVYDHAQLGDHCTLWANAVVRDRCTLGNNCTLHPGVVIGADGFGYRPGQDDAGQFRFVKVPQIGTVTLGNDCEIGANTTIDRAKFDATVLGHGCKLDNLIQIGHNCVLGNHVVIAACTAVGGSCTIGDATMIGGACDIADHVKIGSRVQLAGGAQLIHEVPDGETWVGSPACPAKAKFKELAAIRKLPDLLKAARPLMQEAAKPAEASP
ncbi:MAG: UDP-3-O-(3-hydroxymyristoyl)glucosamine N-acyltransferase [Planctomycetota bacterium]